LVWLKSKKWVCWGEDKTTSPKKKGRAAVVVAPVPTERVLLKIGAPPTFSLTRAGCTIALPTTSFAAASPAATVCRCTQQEHHSCVSRWHGRSLLKRRADSPVIRSCFLSAQLLWRVRERARWDAGLNWPQQPTSWAYEPLRHWH
ncbi:unnamed protein product, partial [Ectocarpus sp. 4 AP-2014]